MDNYKEQLLTKLAAIAQAQELTPVMADDIVNIIRNWRSMTGTKPMPLTAAEIMSAISAHAPPIAGQIKQSTNTHAEDPVHPNPILPPEAYQTPTIKDSTPHDSTQEFLDHMAATFGFTRIQTTFNFTKFSDHHAALNAIATAFVAFNAPPSAVQYVYDAAAKSSLPATYATEHPNRLVVPCDFESLDLLPPGYSLEHLPNTEFDELLSPLSNRRQITTHKTKVFAFPIIIECIISPLKRAEKDVGMWSEFAVLHTMANALVICSPRSATMCGNDVKKPMAFHWFKLGSNLATNIRKSPTPRIFAANKIGSKLVPHWTAAEPSQNQNRQELTVLNAYAVLPPNPKPAPGGGKNGRKRSASSPP